MFFGAHVSSSGGIDKAMDRAHAIGARGVQVFIQSPRMWRPSVHKPEAIERFREKREALDIEGAVAHAIYLINIASDNPDIWEKSVTALEHTMVVGEQLGLDSVIFHPGSHKGDDAGLAGCIDRAALALDRVMQHSENTWLLLENSAGQGGTIGRDTEELVHIIDALDGHPRLGICLDTCHWWVSGVDVRDEDILDAKLNEIDEAVGLHRLQALHLNDAKAELGSNLDRHENLGDGLISDGLRTFLGHPLLQGLGAYLEVPGDGDGPTAEQIDIAEALHEAALV